MRHSTSIGFLALAGLWVASIPAIAEEKKPDLEPVARFRFIQPEIQAARVNQLFEGAKVANPAEALAAWKRATGGKGNLGKTLEAVIAMFNPRMAKEWRFLDASELIVWTVTKAQSKPILDWSIVIPRDDGSLAAFATAGRLTGGRSEPTIQDFPLNAIIERLGTPGAPLAVRLGQTLVVAGTRDALRQAVLADEAGKKMAKPAPADSGVRFTLDAQRLSSIGGDRLGSNAVSSAGKRLKGRKLEGFATLDGDVARVRLHSTGGDPASLPLLRTPPMNQEWLDWIPRSRAQAAVVWAIDPSPPTWASLFSVVDRIEKTDPAKVHMVPFRARLNLLTGIARVQLEVDLWPHLRGASACALGDPERKGSFSGVVVALHLDGEAAARKISDEIAPRISKTFFQGPKKTAKPPGPTPPKVQVTATSPNRLGQVGGRALTLMRRGRTIFVGWGDGVLSACVEQMKEPGGSQLRGVLSAPEDRAVSRVAFLWPARWGLLKVRVEPTSAAGRVLADSEPIVWYGGTNPALSQIDDMIVWRGLHSLVKRFLDTLPLDALCRSPLIVFLHPTPSPDLEPTMRLIDLHCIWLLQYSSELVSFDPALYPAVAARVGQLDGYLSDTRAAGLSCSRTADDWKAQADPWSVLAEMIARYQAEFSGRILMGPDDADRWLREQADGLCWGMIGVGGFDFLVRNAQDLDRLPQLFARGVRILQLIETAETHLGGSTEPGDDRGLTDLGRLFLQSLCDLSPGDSPTAPRPIVDLAHANSSTIADVLTWFEADANRPLLALSHGAVARPDATVEPRLQLSADNLRRLRALGGIIGVGVGPPSIESADDLAAEIRALESVPFRGRDGCEGIAIGTNFLGFDRVPNELRNSEMIIKWVSRTFPAADAAAMIEANGRELFLRATGLPIEAIARK